MNLINNELIFRRCGKKHAQLKAINALKINASNVFQNRCVKWKSVISVQLISQCGQNMLYFTGCSLIYISTVTCNFPMFYSRIWCVGHCNVEPVEFWLCFSPFISRLMLMVPRLQLTSRVYFFSMLWTSHWFELLSA